MNPSSFPPPKSSFDLIFKFEQKFEEISSLQELQVHIRMVKHALKKEKIQVYDEIQKRFKKNQNLTFFAKMLKEDYFRYHIFKKKELKKKAEMEIMEEKLKQQENDEGTQPNQVHISVFPPLKNQKSQIQYTESVKSEQCQNLVEQLNRTSTILRTESIRVSPRPRYLSIFDPYKSSREEDMVKLEIICMFYEMLTSIRMLIYLSQINVKFYVYQILIKKFANFGINCLKKRQVEKGLKFMYQCIKISSNNSQKLSIIKAEDQKHLQISRIYAKYITRMLELYSKDYETEIKQMYEQLKKPGGKQRLERVRLCFSYIFETAILILKKDTQVAASSGIIAMLYKKCIEGKLSLLKVEVITDLFIHLCIEEKSREILLGTIDLGKTCAVFTDVDYLESKNQQKQKDNEEIIQACSIMLEMFVSSWPTLIYFAKQKRTLKNFIITLKRKSQLELRYANEFIFDKILFRALNYSKIKMKKCNNAFASESNFLNYRTIALMNYLFENDSLYEVVQSYDKGGEFTQTLSQLSLEYFSNGFHKESDRLLIRNIKAIKHFQQDIQRHQSKQADQSEDIVRINFNIQSFCSQSILPFDFTLGQIRSYLLQVLKQKIFPQSVVANLKNVMQMIKISNNDRSSIQTVLFQFYKAMLQAIKFIPWDSKFLFISKYLTDILSYLLGQKREQISKICINYLKSIFAMSEQQDYHFLFVNMLDDIGRFFNYDNAFIEFIQSYVKDPRYAYKISRILLHIDTETNQSIDKIDKVGDKRGIYSQICKEGSIELILQIIEIIKFNCCQNQYRFVSEHYQIIFNSLIYHSNEDIVYSIIQMLEEIILKNPDLEKSIVAIDIKRMVHAQKRISYLFLHYEEGVKKLDLLLPSFLRDQLENWIKSNDNLKKNFYYFMIKQVKKYMTNSPTKNQFLNLGFDAANFRKLIFLPWNVKVNSSFYPAFVEFKGLQDKLKLKIYTNQILIKSQIVIQALCIGGHNFTKFIGQQKAGTKMTSKLQGEKNLIKVTLDEIKKQYQKQKSQSKQVDLFLIHKEQTNFFIKFQADSFILERICLEIPLSVDTYLPLVYPLNYIDLLGGTKYGYEFLKKQRFIEHCTEIIIKQMDKQMENSSIINKDEVRGAMMCLGTCCCSPYMSLQEKADVLDLMRKKTSLSSNYELQQISMWILNIIVKECSMRKKVEQEPRFLLLQTKDCGWMCVPNFNAEPNLQLKQIRTKQFEKTKQYIKNNFPERLSNQAIIFLADEISIYLYQCLNDEYYQENNSSNSNNSYQETYKITSEEELRLFQSNNVTAKIFEGIIKYISIIDFQPKKIWETFSRFSNYILSQKFESDFPLGAPLP